MAIKGVETKCYILALFVRDDDERFLLGSGQFEFKDAQKQFTANTIQNDIVEVQGNDGYLLAGQVRRSGTQSFDGYIGDGTTAKTVVEENRRKFFSFFRKNHFYRVIYVFPDGTAIQRKRGFLVDDPTVAELYQQYPEYHVALNFEDVNYYSYSENEQGEEQYAEEAEINLSAIAATGGLVWDEYGAVSQGFTWGGEETATGTDFAIQNNLTIPTALKSVKLNGNTEQQTYTGKNLFDSASATNNKLLAWTTGNLVDNTGSVVSDYIAVSENTQIQLTYLASVFFYDSSKNLIGHFGANQQVITTSGGGYFDSFTVPSGYSIAYIRLNLRASQGTNPSNLVGLDIMVNTGSELLPFEPYVGGNASPNPDYPQDIHVVTGEQTVNITGKNLFSGYTKGIRINPTTGEEQTSSTSASSDFIPLDLTGSNKAIFSGLPNTLYSLVAAYNSEKVFLGRTSAGAVDSRLFDSNSFTNGTPQGTGDVAFIRLCVYENSSASGVIDDIDNANIQLELGDTATPYESYQSQSYTVDLGSLELAKIGDYQDYIYKGADGWYVHKEIGKVVLDGSESWTAISGGGSIRFFFTNVDNIYKTGSTEVSPTYSNYFLPTTLSRIYSGGVDYGIVQSNNGTSASTHGLRVRHKDMVDATAFQSWLSTHNTVVYYALDIPTDTKITNSTLTNQLNGLGRAKLFVGENNVLSLSVEPNLPSDLEITYYTTVSSDGMGYVWEEGGSGGPTMVEIDSITNVYPIWTVFGPAVNPSISVITTNTTLNYNGTISEGQTLVIDMMNKTAKINGTSVIGNVSGDWINLAPGVNRVVYATNNSDTPPSLIEWQEVVG